MNLGRSGSVSRWVPRLIALLKCRLWPFGNFSCRAGCAGTASGPSAVRTAEPVGTRPGMRDRRESLEEHEQSVTWGALTPTSVGVRA